MTKILSAILFAIVLFFALWGLDISIDWMIRIIISPVFSWFYNQHLLIKILLLLIGAPALVGLVFTAFKMIGQIMSNCLYMIFGHSALIFNISLFLVTINLIGQIFLLWHYLTWDFWMIAMWLIIVFFVWEMHSIFIYHGKSEKHI